MSAWLVFALLCAGLFVVGVVLARRDEKKQQEQATRVVSAADWLLLAEAVGVVREGTPIYDALLMEMSAADFKQWEKEVSA